MKPYNNESCNPMYLHYSYISKLLAGLFITICYASASAAPMLNGIGLHNELGQELFAGALYSESLSNDANTLLNSNAAMRMELKIITPDGITPRRFSGMWIEGMAINNKSDALTAQADNMVLFDGLFKARLQKGDQIIIFSAPGKGINISVNGINLGHIDDNKFFTMLLSTWIGRVPLSSDYKDGLLKMGDVSPALRSRYEQIATPAGRRDEIIGWTKAGEAEAKEKAKKEQTLAQEEAKKKAAEELKAKAALTPSIPKPSIATTTIDKPVLTIEKPTFELPALTKTETPAQTTTVAAATINNKPIATNEDDEENQPALTAQSLLARQFYVSDALGKVNSKAKYPRRAQERGQSGSVRIAVTIDRQGNLMGVNAIEESKYSTLTKAALDAVRRAAPFPALPAAIPGTKFVFSVPIRFTLPE
jgi:periplasmic protein TonB